MQVTNYVLFLYIIIYNFLIKFNGSMEKIALIKYNFIRKKFYNNCNKKL